MPRAGTQWHQRPASSPKKNLIAIQESVESNGNKYVTVLELDNLNHLFQECSTGLPTEYAAIEQTCSPKMLETVKNWIVNLIQ